jgi:hypothetical protein
MYRHGISDIFLSIIFTFLIRNNDRIVIYLTPDFGEDISKKPHRLMQKIRKE